MSAFTVSRTAITQLEANSEERLWEVFEGLINDNVILKKISEFNLGSVKPCILELTDGGPGIERVRCHAIKIKSKTMQRTKSENCDIVDNK